MTEQEEAALRLERSAIHEAAHAVVATMIHRGIVEEVFISDRPVDVTEQFDELNTTVHGLTGGVRFRRIQTTVFENGLISYSGFFAECEHVYRSGENLEALLPQLREQAAHDIDRYHALLVSETSRRRTFATWSSTSAARSNITSTAASGRRSGSLPMLSWSGAISQETKYWSCCPIFHDPLPHILLSSPICSPLDNRIDSRMYNEIEIDEEVPHGSSEISPISRLSFRVRFGRSCTWWLVSGCRWWPTTAIESNSIPERENL